MPSGHSGAIRYRSEIDGLRAIAVLSVIFFHAGFLTFSGGFVGVDVFFVISGYLITTIIIREINQGTFSILDFYERRARRILPALFAVVFVSIPIAFFLLLPMDMQDFSKSVAAVSLFSSNILFWRESGYFDAAAELKPLFHTWSLSVEEQYYLLFPVFLLLLWRSGRAVVLSAIIILTAASLLAAEWGAHATPVATFYLLPTRGWELLVGSIVAFHLSGEDRREIKASTRQILSAIGLSLIFYAIVVYDQHTPHPSVHTLVPVVGTALVIVFAGRDTLTARILSHRIPVFIGLISYSAYLWHQPVFAFARHIALSEPGPGVFISLSLFSLLLAFFSWRFIETPFRNRNFLDRRRVFVLSIAVSGILVLTGLSGYVFSRHFEAFWLDQLPHEQQMFYRTVVTGAPSDKNFSSDAEGLQDLAECRFNAKVFAGAEEARILDCHVRFGGGVLILGDSHAVDLFGVVASRFDHPFLVGITNEGCRPHTPSDDCQYEPVRDFITRNASVFSHVVFEQAGFYLLLDRNGKKGSRFMFSNLALDEPVAGLSVDDAHVDATLAYLESLATATRVTWFLPRIEPHIHRKLMLSKGCAFPWRLRPNMRETFDALEAQIVSRIDRLDNPNLRHVSQNRLFGFGFPGDFLTCADAYWSDGDHFSSSGEVRFGRRLPDDFLDFSLEE